MEILNYLASEVHKGFSPLFQAATAPEARKNAVDNLAKKFDWLSAQLAGRKFLMGDTFTVADAYLFTMLRWTALVHIDLSKWPVLAAYLARVHAAPEGAGGAARRRAQVSAADSMAAATSDRASLGAVANWSDASLA
jgi:glutathione S-transferase